MYVKMVHVSQCECSYRVENVPPDAQLALDVRESKRPKLGAKMSNIFIREALLATVGVEHESCWESNRKIQLDCELSLLGIMLVIT